MKNLAKSNFDNAVKLMSKYVKIETAIKNAKNNEQREIIEKIVARKARTETTVKQFCDNLIKEKLQVIANALPDEGYSMGSVVSVAFSGIKATDDRTYEYANGCISKAKHGSVKLKLSLKELRNTTVIGNLVTYIEPNQRAKVKKCYWYEGKGLKNRFELEKVQGFIFNEYHHTDKQKAKDGGQAKIDKEKEAKRLERAYKKACRKQYGYQDSIDAGNCEAGTKAFILRLKLDRNKQYRGNFLLKKAKEKSPSSVRFIENMIKQNM